MAYDEQLAQRLRKIFAGKKHVEEKKMFGGLCFMVSDHMCCGIVGNQLMARVGADNYDHCLQRPHVSEMDFTGKAMKGMVYVKAEGIASHRDLNAWIDLCVEFVNTLPAKKRK